jgi:hypothetical protein
MRFAFWVAALIMTSAMGVFGWQVKATKDPVWALPAASKDAPKAHDDGKSNISQEVLCRLLRSRSTAIPSILQTGFRTNTRRCRRSSLTGAVRLKLAPGATWLMETVTPSRRC